MASAVVRAYAKDPAPAAYPEHASVRGGARQEPLPAAREVVSCRVSGRGYNEGAQLCTNLVAGYEPPEHARCETMKGYDPVRRPVAHQPFEAAAHEQTRPHAAARNVNPQAIIAALIGSPTKRAPPKATPIMPTLAEIAETTSIGRIHAGRHQPQGRLGAGHDDQGRKWTCQSIRSLRRADRRDLGSNRWNAVYDWIMRSPPGEGPLALKWSPALARTSQYRPRTARRSKPSLRDTPAGRKRWTVPARSLRQ